MMSIKSIIPMSVRYKIMDIRGRGIYSLYADEYKCIFIHIPKTAGTSMAKTLFNISSGHKSYIEYELANKKKFNQYYKFAFVRNPWDRLVSTYFFLKSGGLNELDQQWSDKYLSNFHDFDDFVNKWLSSENIWTGIHFKPQYYFVCDERKQIKMNFIGKLENIDEDFKVIAEKLGVDKKLPLINKSRHAHYSEYYNDQTIEIVRKIYSDDIQLFGYEFNSG